MWYAAKKWVNSDNAIDAELSAKGKALASDYGCMDCHGENGEGMDEYPRVGGQNVGYLYEVMKRYRAGAIVSDEMSMLSELSDEQLDALANYMSGLRK
jgi:sulfide dehydrogenase cytochrome subunit